MRVSSPLPEFAVASQHAGSMAATGVNVGPPRMNGAADQDSIPWSRYIDAIRRHALFILALAIAGSDEPLFLTVSVVCRLNIIIPFGSHGAGRVHRNNAADRRTELTTGFIGVRPL